MVATDLASITIWTMYYTFSFEWALGKAPKLRAVTNILTSSGDGTKAPASLSGSLKGNRNLDGMESVGLEIRFWTLQGRLQVLKVIEKNEKRSRRALKV